VLNDGAHVLEALVQPSKDVEDEDPVFNVNNTLHA
jgi:hypothetical protein